MATEEKPMTQEELDLLYDKELIQPSHFWGRITMIMGIVATILVPAYISFVKGWFPGWPKIIAGWTMVLATSGRAYIVEPVSYFPILGIAGTYMAFLAGNISTMRLPCAAASQKAIDADPGTKEAEIAGILGIAASIIISRISLTVLVIAGTVIINALPDVAKEAFKYVLPAVFGSVLMGFAVKGPVYAVFAIIIGLLGQWFLVPAGVPVVFLALGGVILTIGFGYTLRKLEIKKEQAGKGN